MNSKRSTRTYIPEKFERTLSLQLKLQKYGMNSETQLHHEDVEMHNSQSSSIESEPDIIAAESPTAETLPGRMSFAFAKLSENIPGEPVYASRISMKRDHNTLLKNSEDSVYSNEKALVLKRKRIDLLKLLVNTDETAFPEREPDFFTHPSTLRANNVFMRALKCQTNLITYVHFMRLSYFEDMEKDHTFFKVSQVEVDELIEIIKTQIKEIFLSMDSKKPMARIANSKHGAVTDSKLKSYWSSAHTDLVTSKRIGVRPVVDPSGVYCLHFWEPRKESSLHKYKDWIGRTTMMNLGTSVKFHENLKIMKSRMENEKITTQMENGN